MKNLSFLVLLIVTMACNTPKQMPIVSELGSPILVKYPSGQYSEVLDGRMILLLSDNKETELRFQLRDDVKSCQGFGMDVENWQLGKALQFDNSSFGFPIQSMNGLADGTYFMQVLFHKYETFHRSDGHIVKMPMDRGEGQQWNRAPGNLYSDITEVVVQDGNISSSTIQLSNKIPAIEEPKDSKYVKHIKLKSELLSDFWGRDIYLGAHILLPEGYDEHVEARYPLAIMHGHFPKDFGGWRTTPPDPNLKPEYSERFKVNGYNNMVQEEHFEFYKMWTGPDFPRVLAVLIQHPTPFYDDSYAVNSENNGPYGDALTYELIPHIEKQFRGIGEGWARFVYGGSTGGWEALAVQVMYPKEYGACYAACPDPIDFRAYCLVNIYEDENAYYKKGTFKNSLVAGHRDYLGNVDATLKDMNHRELVLGSKGRSGQQWDIWEAVFSPVGADGYPLRIWDRVTGEINPTVAAYWKENYDLAHIINRDWDKHGKDWTGKIHLYCGDMDNYYLNNAVYLAEDILNEVQNPRYNGEVDYGDRAEHCWNGDHDIPNHISRLRYHRMFIQKWASEVGLKAPEGADLTSWRY